MMLKISTIVSVLFFFWGHPSVFHTKENGAVEDHRFRLSSFASTLLISEQSRGRKLARSRQTRSQRGAMGFDIAVVLYPSEFVCAGMRAPVDSSELFAGS